MKDTFLLVLLTLSPSLLFSQNLTMEKSNSSIDFTIKNAGFTVEGNFSDFDIQANFDKKNLPNSYFRGTAAVKSIDTGINARNNSLQEDDYFDENNYPNLEIKSSKIEKLEGNKFQFTGTLKIKGKSKNISFPFTVEETGNNLTAKGKFQINRRDFGVGGKSWLMSDTVKISIVFVGKK